MKDFTKVYIGIGSNIGDSLNTIKMALKKIEHLPSVQLQAVSRFYHTTPVSEIPQDPYINAVCCIKTELQPHELHHYLQTIESKLGKETCKNNLNDLSEQEAADGVVCDKVVVNNTTAEEQNGSDEPRSRSNRSNYSCMLPKVTLQKNAPRTIDLDILFFGTQFINNEKLQVPHPRWKERLFVIAPLADITSVIQVADHKNVIEFNIKNYLEYFPNIHQETVIPIQGDLCAQ
jgi:7,8-dihydro-6-hydroxymethylpterin-pyrophosphokinase